MEAKGEKSNKLIISVFIITFLVIILIVLLFFIKNITSVLPKAKI
ncbi:MAG: hypothetical protein Q7T59_00415 [Candidatus Woesebacteria bacterium]|nr:hypothetical protein [Candidatus Woesebacteria bacterium]